MTVANALLQFYTGEDSSDTDTIYKDAAQTTPQDITGWSISFIVHGIGWTTAIFTKTVGNGIALTDPTNGVLTITLAAADTANLQPGDYAFAVLRTDAGANAELTTGILRLLTR